jgi:antitoxin component YwqK of YwqJK toxin-antitoxin module
MNFILKMLQKPTLLLLFCLIELLSCCKSEVKVKYYANGQVHLIDSLDRHGLSRNFTYFRLDGTLKGKLPIQNEHIQGLVKWYDTRGILESTEVWAKGQKQGAITDYYPNGGVKCRKIMHGSTIVDTSRFYYPTGEEQQTLVRSATGRLIDFGVWHPNGLNEVV